MKLEYCSKYTTMAAFKVIIINEGFKIKPSFPRSKLIIIKNRK